MVPYTENFANYVKDTVLGALAIKRDGETIETNIIANSKIPELFPLEYASFAGVIEDILTELKAQNIIDYENAGGKNSGWFLPGYQYNKSPEREPSFWTEEKILNLKEKISKIGAGNSIDIALIMPSFEDSSSFNSAMKDLKKLISSGNIPDVVLEKRINRIKKVK